MAREGREPLALPGKGRTYEICTYHVTRDMLRSEAFPQVG